MTCIFDNGHYLTSKEWIDRSQIRTLRPWWPRRCCVTNKWLWFNTAVLVRRVITGPGDPIVIDNWVEARAYTLQCLKGWD